MGISYKSYEHDISLCHTELNNVLGLIDLALGKCRNCEKDLIENRNMLILYCQQFAFAPEMVPECAALLTCSQRQLHYSLNFSGSYSSVDHH